MKRDFPKSLAVQFLLFTASLVFLILILDTFQGHLVYSGIWWVLSFFVLLSMGSVAIMKRAAARSPHNFMNIYLAAMVARLFISIIFAAFFILYDKEHVIIFAANFIALYFLFLGFEIYGILTNLRPHFREGPDEQDSTPKTNA